MCEFCSIAQELSACILDICKRLRCRTEQAHNSSSITAQKSWLELYKITRKSQVSSVKLLPGTVCVSGFPVHLHKHHFHQFISHVAVTTPGQTHVWRTRISASPLPGSPAPWVPDVLLGSFLDSCHWVRKKLEVQCLLHRGGADPCLGRAGDPRIV